MVNVLLLQIMRSPSHRAHVPESPGLLDVRQQQEGELVVSSFPSLPSLPPTATNIVVLYRLMGCYVQTACEESQHKEPTLGWAGGKNMHCVRIDVLKASARNYDLLHVPMILLIFQSGECFVGSPPF